MVTMNKNEYYQIITNAKDKKLFTLTLTEIKIIFCRICLCTYIRIKICLLNGFYCSSNDTIPEILTYF